MNDRSTIDVLLLDRKEALDFSVGDALMRLNVFLSSVEERGFTEACHLLLGDELIPYGPVELVEYVAAGITSGLSGQNGSVFNKALQETLLAVCGADRDPDCELSDTDGCAAIALASEDSSGLIETCLCLYVCHTMWLAIQDDLRCYCENEDAFVRSMSVVMSIGETAVAQTIRESSGRRLFERACVSRNEGADIISRVREKILMGVYDRSS